MKYTFEHPASLLKEVEIYSIGKDLEARLYAPEGDDAARLPEIRKRMEENGYRVLADVDDISGKQMLRLGGFDDADSLMHTLADDGAVFGDYSVATTEREAKENKSFGDLLKDKALTTSGWLYLAADVQLIASGVVRDDMAEAAGGVLWAIPSFLLIAGGNQDEKTVEGFMKRDFMEALEDNNIRIPTQASKVLEDGKAERNPWSWLVETTYDLAAPINNVFQIAGGSMMLKAGLNQNSRAKQIAGAAVVTGMSTGLFMPEHEEKKKRSSAALGVGKVDDSKPYAEPGGGVEPGQFQTQLNDAKQRDEVLAPEAEKGIMGKLANIPPLAYSGSFAMINNIANGIAAIHSLREYHQGKTWFGGDERKFNTGLTPMKGEESEKYSLLNNAIKGAEDERVSNDEAAKAAYNNGVEPLKDKQFYDEAVKGAEKSLKEASEANQEFKTKPDGTGLQYPDVTDPKSVEQFNNETDSKYADKVSHVKEKQHELDFATEAQREAQRDATASWLNLSASGTYIAANAFYMLSSKESKADLEKIGAIERVVGVAANIVVGYPEHEQDVMRERLATMLSNNKYIDYSAKDISAAMEVKIDALNQSPWIEQTRRAMLENRPAIMEPDAPQAVNDLTAQELEQQRQSLEQQYSREAPDVPAEEQLSPSPTIVEAQRQSLERLLDNDRGVAARSQQQDELSEESAGDKSFAARMTDRQLAESGVTIH